MKNLKFRHISIMAILFVLFGGCKKNTDDEVLRIDRVSLNNRTTTDSTVTQVRLGATVRLDGSGFSTTKAVYANGVKLSVNPGFVTNNHIIFRIPSDLPFGSDLEDPSVRNTIKVVTDNGTLVYPFIIQGAVPVITGISHTLPKEGDEIQLFGTALRDINTITLPGGVALNQGQFSINSERTVITFKVPAGGTSTPGAIRLDGDNGSANSYAYFNDKRAWFVDKFSNDPSTPGAQTGCDQRAYNYGTTISGNKTDLLPATGAGPKNPESYRQVPVSVATLAIDQIAGGFDFRSCSALNAALINGGGSIVTETTPIRNLAIQFDIYIPVTWQSGYIRFDFVSGNTQWRYYYAPWAVGGGTVSPVQLDGWRTVTIPFNVFSGLNANSITTFRQLLDYSVGKGGAIRFINANYTDGGGAVYPASAIENFQLSMGNFRIVSYTRPSVN